MAFKWPLNNFSISQGFGGNADYYRQFGQQGHNGVDLAAAAGTPVYAADEGTVVFEGWGQNHSWMGSPAGICVLINHGGSHAGYAHMTSTVVNKGQRVSKGQHIGYVGSTGAATGPHLHFEMLPLSPNFNNGFAGRINPMPYIETTTNATDDQIRQAYRDILEREADAAGISHYRNYPIDFVRSDLANSQEKRQLEARKAEQARLEAERRAEEARQEEERRRAEEEARKAQEELDRIKAEEERARQEAEQKAKDMQQIVLENNTLLKQILALIEQVIAKLTGIFK
ncbi:M23 family metallopeptidase [Prescottella equi]|uniref:M23 family metallopeptidase n=1 Tax=Rhodococcus hoagii TaxID=43767 RepID=UPI001F5BE06A|nr:M23 family metallopeptidase [Prescottella equi]UNQ40959.1 M23 family metallopeptidase [Prescottella equi]